MVLELIMVGNRQTVGLGDEFPNIIWFVSIRFVACVIRILALVDMVIFFLWECKPIGDMGVGSAFRGTAASSSSSETSSSAATAMSTTTESTG